MNYPRSETKVIIGALRILANDIQSDDGIANACVAEAAMRLEELDKENDKLKYEAELLRSLGLWNGIDDKSKSGEDILLWYREKSGIEKYCVAYWGKNDNGEESFITADDADIILDDCLVGYRRINLGREGISNDNR